MSHPVVLITPSTTARGAEFLDFSLNLSMKYPMAIQAFGGIPMVAPCNPDKTLVAKTVARVDGVLMTGGDDVAPEMYMNDLTPELGKTVHRAAPERDLFELMVIDEVFRQRKPLMAICRGHQLLNVALGGNLIVDIHTERPKSLKHNRMDKKSEVVHEVETQSGSLLAKVTGKKRFGVNSTHHQAVKNVAKPLRATAVSIDGIVEGMELGPDSKHMLPYLLSVQFHPERLVGSHAEHRQLFESFLDACQRFGRK